MTYLIYIIIDPITHGVVYVGRTRDIEKRKSDYLRFNRVHSVKIKKYFEEMAIKKVVPIFIVIGEYDACCIVEREIHYIKYFSKQGPLLNTVYVKEFAKYSLKKGVLSQDGKTICS